MKNFNFQDLVYFQEWPWILSKQFTTKWVKILNVRNIVNWNLDISNTTTYISEDEAYWKYKHFLIDWDEIIIASSWIKVEYFDKKVCFANKENLPLMLNTSIIRLRSLDETVLLKWYLYYFLKSQIFKNQIQRLITWSAQLNFWPSHLKQIQIPLPSLSTQKQIIQKLDKLSELISLRKQSIKKQEDLTKSIFIEMFWDPMINEKGWEVKKIEELVEKTKNSLKTWPFGSALKKEFYVEKWWKIYWQEQVIKNDINYWDYYISDTKYNELINYSIKEWDVLISLVWSYWNLLIIPKKFEAWIINPRLLKITFDKELINPVFFKFFFLSDSHLIKLDSIVHWWTMWILNLWLIKSLDIYLPPISLQNKFAEIVQKNEENIKKQKESLEKLEELYNWVMQESFRV